MYAHGCSQTYMDQTARLLAVCTVCCPSGAPQAAALAADVTTMLGQLAAAAMEARPGGRATHQEQVLLCYFLNRNPMLV